MADQTIENRPVAVLKIFSVVIMLCVIVIVWSFNQYRNDPDPTFLFSGVLAIIIATILFATWNAMVADLRSIEYR